jgi:hypothetical protein
METTTTMAMQDTNYLYIYNNGKLREADSRELNLVGRYIVLYM